MNFGKLAPLALTSVLMAGGFATAAAAQQPPAPATQPGGPRLDRPAKMDPEARAQRRAEHLRTTLQLRPEQEGALKAYIDALKPAAGARDQMRERRQQMAAMTTPQRLDAMKAKRAERDAAFDRRATATKRFYAQLSPTQQKAFDATAMKRGKGKGGHKGGGRHHGGMDRGD